MLKPSRVRGGWRWGGGLLASLALAPTALSAQAAPSIPEHRVSVGVGWAFSSPIVEDAVVDGRLLDTLRVSAVERAPLEARPGMAPVVTVAGWFGVADRLWVGLGGGLTFSELEAVSRGEARDVQGLDVGHVSFALLRQVSPSIAVRLGTGLIRYSSEARGLFTRGSESAVFGEAGGAWLRRLGDWSLSVEATGQLHRFDTISLQSLGGSGGMVYRGLISVGLGRGVGQ